MTDITPSSARIQVEAEDFRSPVSEASMFAIGGAINECLDRTDQDATDIAALQAQDVVFARSIYQRGEIGTSYGYTLNEPFGETLVTTAALTVRANPDENTVIQLNFKFNEGTASASYSVTGGPSGSTFTTTFRVTRQINAGAETNIISYSQSSSLGALANETGVFLGAWRGFQKNIETDIITITTDSTVTYRIYVDFNVTFGAPFTAGSFSASNLGFSVLQLR